MRSRLYGAGGFGWAVRALDEPELLLELLLDDGLDEPELELDDPLRPLEPDDEVVDELLV